MKNSAQRIRTSHVGRLPVPSGFEETALRLARGEVGGEEMAAQVVPGRPFHSRANLRSVARSALLVDLSLRR